MGTRWNRNPDNGDNKYDVQLTLIDENLMKHRGYWNEVIEEDSKIKNENWDKRFIQKDQVDNTPLRKVYGHVQQYSGYRII